MKADELMIGSWVLLPDGRQVQLQSIDPSGYPKAYTQIEGWEYWPWSVVQGVVLSEEWLKRAGVEEVTMSWYTEPCFSIVVAGETFFYWLTEGRLYWDEVPLPKFEFVHELQLTTFALTGTHLTFDEK
jgi:hypothetical protein